MSLQQSVNDIFRENRSETVTTVAVLAFSLLIPGLIALGATFFADAARGHLEAYRPVVYLAGEAGEESAKKLAGELDAWTMVGEAKLRAPEEAYGDLRERLGDDELADLGVSANMLPYSIVLEPSAPVVGHLELIADTSGLEARSIVDSVDVPSQQAEKTLSFVRWVLLFGAVLFFGLLVTGTAQLRNCLVRLADREADQRRLLTAFGARPGRLRRPTLLRAVSLGAFSGVTATAGLLLALLLWHSARPALVGAAHGVVGWSWIVLVAPLLAGPLAGLFAGWLANRRIYKRAEVDELQMRDMLG